MNETDDWVPSVVLDAVQPYGRLDEPPVQRIIVCPQCGKEMTAYMGGWWCESCGSCLSIANNTLSRLSHEFQKPTPLIGWVCPKCGRALSPTTTECPCYKNESNKE